MFDFLKKKTEDKEKAAYAAELKQIVDQVLNARPKHDGGNPQSFIRDLWAWNSKCTALLNDKIKEKRNYPDYASIISEQIRTFYERLKDEFNDGLQAEHSKLDYVDTFESRLRKNFSKTESLLRHTDRQFKVKQGSETQTNFQNLLKFFTGIFCSTSFKQYRAIHNTKLDYAPGSFLNDELIRGYANAFEIVSSLELHLNLSYELEGYLIRLTELLKCYLSDFLYYYALNQALVLYRNKLDKLPQMIIARLSSFADNTFLNILDDAYSVGLILPRNQEKINYDLNANKERIRKQYQNTALENKVFWQLGRLFVVNGYNNNNQSMILKGAALLKFLNVQFISPSISKHMVLAHGIVAQSTNDEGFKKLENPQNWMDPEEYMKKIQRKMSVGLIASNREDSQIDDAALKHLQEVWFFNYDEVKNTQFRGSYYGPINFLFRPQDKYAIFAGRSSDTGHKELFILTKEPIKGPFEIILLKSYYSKIVGQYMHKLEQLLKKANISFKTV